MKKIEESRILGCYAVWLLQDLTFRWNYFASYC
jgi:hypothetical protein